MKSKESPNLYEILKTTSRSKKPVHAPETETSQPVRIEEPRRLSVAEVAPRPVVPKPQTTPIAPQLAQVDQEPGEKVIRITYNTAIFLVLAGIGLLFIAYAIGVRSGRARAVAEMSIRPLPSEGPEVGDEETVPPVPAAAAILDPIPEKMWTIKLLEWSGQTARDRIKAQQNAERIKKSLTQSGFPASYYQLVTRKEKKFVVLRYGKYEERNRAEARKVLEKLQRFKYRGTAYFTRSGLESIDKD